MLIGILVTSDLDAIMLDRIDTSHPLPFEALLAVPSKIEVMRAVEPRYTAALLTVVDRLGGCSGLVTPGMDVTVAT